MQAILLLLSLTLMVTIIDKVLYSQPAKKTCPIPAYSYNDDAVEPTNWSARHEQ